MTNSNLPGRPGQVPAPGDSPAVGPDFPPPTGPPLVPALPSGPNDSEVGRGSEGVEATGGGPNVRPPHQRVGRLAVALVAALAVLAGAVWATSVAVAPVPYYALTPGDARPVTPLMKVPADKRIAPNGEVMFVTVGVQPMRRITKWWYERDPNVSILPARSVLGDQTPEQYRQANVADMTQSKDLATATAMNRAGLPVVAKGEGAVVTAIGKDTAADRAGLLPSDVVVEVAVPTPADGGTTRTSVHVANDLVKAVQAAGVGTTVTLTLDRIKDPTAVKGRDPDPANIERVTVPLTLGGAPDDAGRPYMGVGLLTRKPTFDLPYKVDIDTGKIGGPSAGLAFTLSLLDQITPGDLTGGKKVAVTGTIGPNATVGLVGGVEQKTVAARKRGASLFIVPKNEVADATKHAGDMKVVGVETLEEALEALRANGGDLSGLPPISQIPRL